MPAINGNGQLGYDTIACFNSRLDLLVRANTSRSLYWRQIKFFVYNHLYRIALMWRHRNNEHDVNNGACPHSPRTYDKKCHHRNNPK